jgi:hypothetical protein
MRESEPHKEKAPPGATAGLSGTPRHPWRGTRSMTKYMAFSLESVNPTNPYRPDFVPIERGFHRRFAHVSAFARGRSARELAQTKGFRACRLRISGPAETKTIMAYGFPPCGQSAGASRAALVKMYLGYTRYLIGSIAWHPKGCQPSRNATYGRTETGRIE